MIPNIPILNEEITDIEYANRTYRISDNNNRIDGYVDELDAVKQSIYLILSTERYEFPIYSWDYGVEFIDLFGQPLPYVMSELERRIKEALTQDDRISDVHDFKFNKYKNKVQVTFTVVSNAGEIPTATEVEI